LPGWAIVTVIVVAPPALVARYRFPLLIALFGRALRASASFDWPRVCGQHLWRHRGLAAGSQAAASGWLSGRRMAACGDRPAGYWVGGRDFVE
jgi:hypothetical protein